MSLSLSGFDREIADVPARPTLRKLPEEDDNEVCMRTSNGVLPNILQLSALEVRREEGKKYGCSSGAK